MVNLALDNQHSLDGPPSIRQSKF